MNLARKKKSVSSKQKAQQIHYDVYIYHHPANTNEQVHDWERKSSTADPRRALLKARRLHKSKKYQKVEVKKRKFDTKHNCMFASTMKVYGADTNYKKMVLLLMAIAAVSSTVAAILLYLS